MSKAPTDKTRPALPHATVPAHPYIAAPLQNLFAALKARQAALVLLKAACTCSICTGSDSDDPTWITLLYRIYQLSAPQEFIQEVLKALKSTQCSKSPHFHEPYFGAITNSSHWFQDPVVTKEVFSFFQKEGNIWFLIRRLGWLFHSSPPEVLTQVALWAATHPPLKNTFDGCEGQSILYELLTSTLHSPKTPLPTPVLKYLMLSDSKTVRLKAASWMKSPKI